MLISAPEMRRRLLRAGFTQVRRTYCIFFPAPLAALRPLERAMGWLPLGAQYSLLARCFRLGLSCTVGLAGIANTLAGHGVILVALFAGATDIAANAMGYAFGLLVSFTLNRRFFFGRSGRPLAQEMTRFLLAFALACLVNLGVLLGARDILGQGNPLSQLPAIIAYTAVFFLLSRHFVFARRA